MSGGAEGTGNYKGVMLCNRPMDGGAAPSGPSPMHLIPEVNAPRFRPVGLPAEPLGLNPAKENLVCNVLAMEREAARRRETMPQQPRAENFLSKHRRWIADMTRKKAELNAELQASAEAAARKKTKFVAYTRSIREAIRERGAEDVFATKTKAGAASTAALTADAEACEGPSSNAAPPKDEPPSASAASKGGKKGAAALKSKPKWALTEGEAEEVEEAEADELVDFASALDYENYIDDLEVRQALSVIKERIDHQKALEAAAAMAEAASAEDDLAAELGEGADWRTKFLSEWNGSDAPEDDRSSMRSTRRRAAAADATGDSPEWDASTATGEVARHGPSGDARSAAEEMLRSNPALAAKHSVRSLAAAVQTAQDKPAAAAAAADGLTQRSLAEMTAELPPLKMVTIHENPRVMDRNLDASNLPYLHRNPAV